MRNIELRLEMGGMQGGKPFGFESLGLYARQKRKKTGQKTGL